MTYVILTERGKPRNRAVDYAGDNFYSRLTGCFSPLKLAQTFPTFEAAQPTVRKLRASGLFIYAVPARALP